LTSARQVSETGFEATWKINSLNRSDVDQTFYSTDSGKTFQTVGAKLLVPGGQYTQTDRALKYAFLVILLSLMAVYVGEMSVRAEINFLNYLLIGAALVLFYLMLLSFGEWIGFSWSYGLSALLVLGMITLYLKAIVRKGQAALAVCLFMALIDVFVYVLLSLADMALLVGTLGLFVVLGAAMYFSLRMVSDRKTSASMEKKRN
jgi:inner membrane protein